MSRRLVAATAVALLFLLYSARASAQSGGIWIAGGVLSTGGGRIATDYEPPLLFGLQGVSRATQTVDVDRGCFACALGGPDGSTLFIAAAEWRGPERFFDQPYSGQVLVVDAPAPGAGWP